LSFFSPAPDRAPEHTGAASRRSPVDLMRGESWRRRISCPCTFPKGREVAARSSSPQSIRVPRGSASKSCATIRSTLPSTTEGGLSVLRRSTPHLPILGSVQSTGKCSADSHASCERSPSPTDRDHTPKPRASADTIEHHAHASTAFPTADAGRTTNSDPSYKRSQFSATLGHNLPRKPSVTKLLRTCLECACDQRCRGPPDG
jgi:hypothetical protein